MWTYAQRTGEMSNGTLQFFGYAGHGSGMNNPDMADVKNVGPPPVGLYSMGPWHDELHLGPCVTALSPVGHDADGRTSLMIHGDNASQNHSGSDGCIVLGPTARHAMRDGGDTSLSVVRGDEDERDAHTS